MMLDKLFMDSFELASKRLDSTIRSAKPAKPEMKSPVPISYHRQNIQLEEDFFEQIGDSSVEAAIIIKHGLMSDNQGVIDAFKRFYMLAKLTIPADDEQYNDAKKYVAHNRRTNQDIVDHNKKLQDDYDYSIQRIRNERQNTHLLLLKKWDEFLDRVEIELKEIKASKAKHTKMQEAIIKALSDYDPELPNGWWKKFDKTLFKVHPYKKSQLNFNEYTKEEARINQVLTAVVDAMEREFNDIYSTMLFDQILDHPNVIEDIQGRHKDVRKLNARLSFLEDRRYHFMEDTHYKWGNPYSQTTRTWMDDDIDEVNREIQHLYQASRDQLFNLIDIVDVRIRQEMVLMYPNDFTSVRDLGFIAVDRLDSLIMRLCAINLEDFYENDQ